MSPPADPRDRHRERLSSGRDGMGWDGSRVSPRYKILPFGQVAAKWVLKRARDLRYRTPRRGPDVGPPRNKWIRRVANEGFAHGTNDAVWRHAGLPGLIPGGVFGRPVSCGRRCTICVVGVLWWDALEMEGVTGSALRQ